VTRRTFISGITLGLLATPRGAEAQQARVYRVGVILQSLLARGDEAIQSVPDPGAPNVV